MSERLTETTLREAFDDFRIVYGEEDKWQWRDRYVGQVRRVQEAAPETWLTPEFQRSLWTDGGVSSIGAGNAVTLDKAYGDMELARWLLEVRDAGLDGSPEVRGAALQGCYDELIARVFPRYTAKRPRARTLRLLAAIFPEDMTSLMDTGRIWQVQTLIGAPRVQGGVVAQHPAVRERIREVLGAPSDLEGTVEQAMFSWFLWETRLRKVEPSAVAVVGGDREAADLPELHLLPANAQRRSLFSVQNNVGLLLSVVREAENGAAKEDLLSFIRSEAPHLALSSAGNVLHQALGGAFGLLRFENGAYRPTDRGFEFLTAPSPAHILRAPLIGHVFGVAHLLQRLARSADGLLQKEAVAAVQALVPSWTTSQPASYIVQWAKLTDLVRAEETPTGLRLHLTDDGQDYEEALPKDFEERWRITATTSDEEVEVSAAKTSEVTRATYNVADIVREGSFLPEGRLTEMLDLLKRKMNVILQGPPGTGKTWLARRLGYALVGVKDEARVTSVQFQPSYAYEDFVCGFRPHPDGGPRLVDGLFLRLIDQAKRTDGPVVLVIEEINRGDPAQVFGELLTLLETGQRGGDGLRLAYAASDTPVSVPKTFTSSAP